MKLISLTQPWAALVAHGFKRFETRGWFTDYRGPLAIHATKGPPDMLAVTRLSEKYPQVFEALDLIDEHGTIIATCEVVGCHLLYKAGQHPPVNGTPLTPATVRLSAPGFEGVADPEREMDFGDWRVGRCILDLQKVRRVVPHAIPRGSQGRPVPLDPTVEAALRYL